MTGWIKARGVREINGKQNRKLASWLKSQLFLVGARDQDEDIGVGAGLLNDITDERRELIVVTGGITLAVGNHLLTDQILARALSKLFSRPRRVLDLDWFTLFDVGGCEIGGCECWQLTRDDTGETR